MNSLGGGGGGIGPQQLKTCLKGPAPATWPRRCSYAQVMKWLPGWWRGRVRVPGRRDIGQKILIAHCSWPTRMAQNKRGPRLWCLSGTSSGMVSHSHRKQFNRREYLTLGEYSTLTNTARHSTGNTEAHLGSMMNAAV